MKRLERLECRRRAVAKRILDELKNHAQAHFEKILLPDVCEYFSAVHNVPIRVDVERCQAEGIEVADTLITVQSLDVPLRDLLTKALRSHGLALVINTDAVTVTTQKAADERRAGITRLQESLPNLTQVWVAW